MKASKGILFGSLLAALSTSPLLIASPAQAVITGFNVGPAHTGTSVFQCTWTTTCYLSASTSQWTFVSFFYDYGGKKTNLYAGVPDGGVQTGPGTFATSRVVFLPNVGTYAAYNDDRGTDPSNSSWFYEIGPITLVVLS